MKVACKTKNLSDVFQLVCSVVESKATKRILQDVRIATQGKNALKVSATDLEIGIKCTVEAAEVIEEGATVVPAIPMGSILRESSDESIELSVEGSNCHVRGKDSFFRLPTQNPDEFPVIPDFPGERTVEIGQEDLRTMIRRTIFAVAVEQTHYALNGILFKPKKGKLTLVATDGRRLAQITRKAKVEGKDVRQAIVPTKAASVMDRMLSEGEGKVDILLDQNKVWVRAGNASLCAALVEGQFPDYDAVVPSECELKIPIQTSELLSAVRRAALLTDINSQAVRLHFEENLLTLRYEEAERGEAKVELPVKYDGKATEACFNPQFMVDMLKAVDEDEVLFELKDSNTAGLLRAGDDYLYLIMPISVADEGKP